MSQIVDHLFLSCSVEDAKQFLIEQKIGRVLTVASAPIPKQERIPGVQYRHIRMSDKKTEEILASQKLHNALAYIEESVNRGINIVQKRRPLVHPIESFIRQLDIFEKLEYRCDSQTLRNSKLFREYAFSSENSREEEIMGNKPADLKSVSSSTSSAEAAVNPAQLLGRKKMTKAKKEGGQRQNKGNSTVIKITK